MAGIWRERKRFARRSRCPAFWAVRYAPFASPDAGLTCGRIRKNGGVDKVNCRAAAREGGLDHATTSRLRGVRTERVRPPRPRGATQRSGRDATMKNGEAEWNKSILIIPRRQAPFQAKD